MKGGELLRKLKDLAKRRGLALSVDETRGKGSHITVEIGGRRTILRNPKDELKIGTFHAMLKQLGIDEKDLYQ